MLERRRKARYGALADDEVAGDDVELSGMGHGRDEESGLGPQENGVMSLEQEVDNWDENAVDRWDEEDGLDEHGNGVRDQKAGGAGATAGIDEGKKRSD